MPRRVDPLTAESTLYGRKRAQLTAQFQRIEEEIRQLDRQLCAIAERRRALREQLRRHRSRLWSRLTRTGRCPLPDGAIALPPIRNDAVSLWGRRLRARCRELLERHGGPLPLRDLHALLHHQGYVIEGNTPVKTLAEAMRYELSLGHVRRVERGVYERCG